MNFYDIDFCMSLHGCLTQNQINGVTCPTFSQSHMILISFFQVEKTLTAQNQYVGEDDVISILFPRVD